MQKLLSLILCIIVLCTLASCGKNPEHEHEFSMAWSSDEDYHWHQATNHLNHTANSQILRFHS